MPVANDVISVAEMLEKYGPWGVCVVFLILLIYLYISKNKDQRDYLGLLEKRHEQFSTIIEKCYSCLEKVNENLKINSDQLQHNRDENIRLRMSIDSVLQQLQDHIRRD